MNLIFPELFCLISVNLNDKEKIFLISTSKIIYNFKSLLVLDSEYNLEEVNDKWRAKNIHIKEFSLKIKELIKDLIPGSIMVNSKYAKFVSNNINIKLFFNKHIIEELISYGYHYLATKIILNNDNSIDNKFKEVSHWGYPNTVKLLIDLGADINANDNQAIIDASIWGSLPLVKLLIELGAAI